MSIIIIGVLFNLFMKIFLLVDNLSTSDIFLNEM